jgi:hypothetical protein
MGELGQFQVFYGAKTSGEDKKQNEVAMKVVLTVQ